MEKFAPARRKFEHQGHTIYEWDQTIDEVNIYVSPPEGITSKMIACQILPNKLVLGIKGNPAFIDEIFYSTVKCKDSYWTWEDGMIHITLHKMNKAETWYSALRGHQNKETDLQINEEVKKKIMLERFQEEHPGFDFSAAEFSGQSPDPRTFMGGMKE
eukprot:gene12398-14550_t